MNLTRSATLPLPRARREAYLCWPGVYRTLFRRRCSVRMSKRGLEQFFSENQGEEKKSKKLREELPDFPPFPESRKGTSTESPDLPLGQFRFEAEREGDGSGDPVKSKDSESSAQNENTSEGKDGNDALQALIAANRNSAFARQAVTQANKEGVHLLLSDLLVEPSWKEKLNAEFNKPYMPTLEAFLQKEWSEGTVFPAPFDIFRAMNSVPFDRVRVVIIGQDPYHNTNQAMGLSFSVPKSEKVPSSLQNIYKEIASDVGCTKPTHGDLTKWSSQGVLLLNAVLTVKAHKANSHAKKGWENFTDAAISQLNKHRSGLVFILWGRFAQTRGKNVNTSKHLVLKSVHPSGLSANKGFYGCKHFSKTNAYLEKKGHKPIDWQIE